MLENARPLRYNKYIKESTHSKVDALEKKG